MRSLGLATRQETKMNIVPFNEEERSASEVLNDALSSEYESVVIIGYKSGEVHIHQSKVKSMTEVVGAIEIAKDQLFRTW